MQTFVPRRTSITLPDATFINGPAQVLNKGWYDVTISGAGWAFKDATTGETVAPICRPGQAIRCYPSASRWRRLFGWLRQIFTTKP